MKRFDKPDGYLVVSRSKERRTNAIQDERSKIFVHTVAPFRPLTQRPTALSGALFGKSAADPTNLACEQIQRSSEIA